MELKRTRIMHSTISWAPQGKIAVQRTLAHDQKVSKTSGLFFGEMASKCRRMESSARLKTQPTRNSLPSSRKVLCLQSCVQSTRMGLKSLWMISVDRTIRHHPLLSISLSQAKATAWAQPQRLPAVQWTPQLLAASLSLMRASQRLRSSSGSTMDSERPSMLTIRIQLLTCTPTSSSWHLSRAAINSWQVSHLSPWMTPLQRFKRPAWSKLPSLRSWHENGMDSRKKKF